ncbi:heavy metal translocating P-type ATPase [Pseudodonghicola flavimaris]|uniref:Cation-translocating P-type ATPase n=1 Tax=Pseudodonghicola flavimaris TaxID=3050036 RepID=A0ABT7F2S0_9RHOB|nr:cation-translocating P-type ATPase [Pseudodonghicola flavimaris]MDK3018901.1 cation-translocating P-type ATPase [Pseudodonghicola flavimaris]
MRRLFAIDGLACAGCARGLENRLSALPGVNRAGVHYLTGSALIDWDDTALSPEALARATAAAGYRMIERLRPEETSAALGREIHRLGVRLAVAVVAGMWSMLPAIVIYLTDLSPTVSWWLALASGIFALPVVFWAGSGFLWMAWRSIRLRSPGMDLLVSIGTLSACLASGWALWQGQSVVWFDTATMLVTLLLFGRLVDVVTRRRAIDALSAMEAAAPELARVETPDGWHTRPCAEVAPGQRVAVDAGAPISMDGVVVSGRSQVNRAVLTGETRLVPVGPGDRVEAGALNLGQRLILRVERAHGDREIDRMGGAIALEIARRGAARSVADTWAERLSIAIPVLGGLAGLAGLLLGLGPEESLLRALTLLVGVCPCALSIALPLAQMRAAQVAAEGGLRLRDPEGFAALARARSIVFDKTGTLTEGRLRVAALRPADGWSGTDLLALAARAETGIRHPIAEAIVTAHGGELGEGGQRLPRGAEARTPEGGQVRVSAGAEQGLEGRSWLQVTLEGRPVGEIALADTPARGAAEMIACLRAEGLALRIATGDGAGAAMGLARDLGLSPAEVRHGCTPADKVALIETLPKPVIFVGDGVNDGPALAAAECGISVASAHSAAAQTADVVVTAGGLDRVLAARALSRRFGRIARENLVLALAYNAVIVPAAFTGVLGPAAAALAMLASSVSVVLNSQRLGSRAGAGPGADTATVLPVTG